MAAGVGVVVKNKRQSWTVAKVEKADFIQDWCSRGRDLSVELGSIPNTTGQVGIYSQGAGWGQWMEKY